MNKKKKAYNCDLIADWLGGSLLQLPQSPSKAFPGILAGYLLAKEVTDILYLCFNSTKSIIYMKGLYTNKLKAQKSMTLNLYENFAAQTTKWN